MQWVCGMGGGFLVGGWGLWVVGGDEKKKKKREINDE